VQTETCLDWADGYKYIAPNVAWVEYEVQISLAVAIDASDPVAVAIGQEYYAGGVTILNGKTVGDGACTGCSDGMDFWLRSLTVANLDGRQDRYEEWSWPNYHPVDPHLYWNRASDATRSTSWGQVKGLYR
jgi:hypothetical protein